MRFRGAAGWAVGALATLLAAAVAWWSWQDAHARHHWRQAQSTLEQQDTARARDHLAHCLAWWPHRLEVRLLAARAARLAGCYEDAEEHLAYCEAHAEESSSPAARRERALLQVEQGDFRGQLELLAPRGPRDPQLPVEVLDAMAHGFALTFYNSTALECLGRLHAQEPGHVRGNLLAGNIWDQMKFPDRARFYFERAVSGLPNTLTPRLRLAECLLKLGEIPEAAAHLQALRERYPEEPAVAQAWARLHVYRAQPDEANRILDALLAAHADHIDALVERGRIEWQSGDPAYALPWLERAVALNPDCIEAWQILGHCHGALTRPAEVNRCSAEVDRLNRQLGEVTRLTLMATQDRPTDLALRLEIADRFERLHQPAKAAAWRLGALQLDPAAAPTHRALAEGFRAMGQPHRAARHAALAGQSTRS